MKIPTFKLPRLKIKTPVFKLPKGCEYNGQSFHLDKGNRIYINAGWLHYRMYDGGGLEVPLTLMEKWAIRKVINAFFAAHNLKLKKRHNDTKSQYLSK